MRLLRFFRRPDWQLEKVVPPWGHRPSIYAYVAESVRTATTSLSRANIDLPDETIIAGKHGLRFAAGAMDGVMGHHGSETENPVAVAVLRSLVALAEHATSRRTATLYSQLVERSTLEYVDVLLPRLLHDPGVQRERVHAIARWLATAAADREPVKFAIALLGVLSTGEDSDLLMTLGRHEEFTLFSAVALGQSDPSPDRALWELGQHVTGWGRIHVVERLRATQNEQIKAWLLRDGCRNDIMDEYTALICAKTGGLVTALQGPTPDDALLEGAGAILVALINGGPAEDMTSYAEGAEATALYLQRLAWREPDLAAVNVVARIKAYVASLRERPEDAPAGWLERLAGIQNQIEGILSRPGWEQRIRAGLSSTDRGEFFNAMEAAKLFAVDTWDEVFRRLQRGEEYWHQAMQTHDPLRLQRVVQFAEARLPLDAIATGPGNALGIGPGFEAHLALDVVLQDLRRIPGIGWHLIRAGLQSPVVRNRHMAIRALAEWNRVMWPAEAETLLAEAERAEPDTEVRERLQKLLGGEAVGDEAS